MSVAFHSLINLILSAAFSLHTPFNQGWLKPRSFDLRVQEKQDQLVITWNPYAVRKGHTALVQVRDGLKRMTWFVSPELRSITYVRETDNTLVRLISDGNSQTEIVLGLPAQPQHPRTAARVDDEAENFAWDLADVRVLRTKIQNENRRLVLLEHQALLLLNTASTNVYTKQF